MSARPPARPKRSAVSLVALLQALQGRRLTLELRRDVSVTGTLAAVDEFCNCWIDDALWSPMAQGPAVSYPSIYVKGRNLRMVHLPGDLDAAAALDAHIEAEKKRRAVAAVQLLNQRHGRLAKGASSSQVEGPGGEAGVAD